MTKKQKEALDSGKDLDKIKEYRFYVKMSLKTKLKIAQNKDILKKKRDENDKSISQSRVLEIVMTEFMHEDEFLEFIGLL